MKKVLLSLIILFVIHAGDCMACRKRILDNDKPIASQFDKTNTTYIIKDDINLNGLSLVIPENCSLLYEGGVIRNGKLVGNKTKIKCRSSVIFEGIEFEGSFLGAVQESWFPLKYDVYYDNSFELNSALNLAHLSDNKTFCLSPNKVLYVRSDVDNSLWPTYLRYGTVEIKSGVTFDLNGSTIKCLTNSSHQYNILFSKDQQDICIKNGVICGDLETHTGSDGQWGHGIALEGVENYIIENVECLQCWGDGINLQVSHNGDGNETSSTTTGGHCMYGLLINVNCHHNRRQGMSIGGALYLEVNNCVFSDTKGSNPQSGVDIEPNKPENIAAHIKFNHCLFSANAHQGITISGDSVYDIDIKDCKYYRNEGYDIQVRGKDVRINNCHGYDNTESIKIRMVANAEDVTISNCTLSKIYAQHSKFGETVKEVLIKNCRFDWTNSGETRGLYDDKKLRLCSMTFEGCAFAFNTLPHGENLSYNVLNSENEYHFNNCVFDCANRIMNVSSTLHFSRCKFKNLQSVVCSAGPQRMNSIHFMGCVFENVKSGYIFEIQSPRDSRWELDLTNSSIDDHSKSLIHSTSRVDVQLKARGASLPSEGYTVSSMSKARVIVIN
jgi:hypothetical protein